MRISAWRSDVCSSDLCRSALGRERFTGDTRSRPSALLQRPALPAAGPQTTISPPPHRLVAMPAHSSATPVKISRALLSVSDKTGLVDLARAFAARGVDLLSTGENGRAHV